MPRRYRDGPRRRYVASVPPLQPARPGRYNGPRRPPRRGFFTPRAAEGGIDFDFQAADVGWRPTSGTGQARRVGPSGGHVRVWRRHRSGGEDVAQTHSRKPRCMVIAGPNGAGKTTFAREFLPREGGIMHFVNADLIAEGLSPLRPALAAMAAGRLMLKEMERLAAARRDFAIESTLSGRGLAARLRRWKKAGYGVEIVFLRLSTARLALKRVAMRVRQVGHDVPRADVLRRFDRG